MSLLYAGLLAGVFSGHISPERSTIMPARFLMGGPSSVPRLNGPPVSAYSNFSVERKNDVVSDMAKISSPSADLDNQILRQQHILLDPISHCRADEAVRSRNTRSCSNLDFEV